MTLAEHIRQAVERWDGPVTEADTRAAVAELWAAYRARRRRAPGVQAPKTRAAGLRLQRRVLSSLQPRMATTRRALAERLSAQRGRPALLPGELDAALAALAGAGAVVLDGDQVARMAPA